MIEVTCGKCNKQYRTDSKYVGQRIKCGNCGQRIEIVAPKVEEAATDAVSDALVPTIASVQSSPYARIASVLVGFELTWLALVVASLLVLAPYPEPGKPWPMYTPIIFGSTGIVAKRAIAVFLAFAVAGLLLFLAHWANRRGNIPSIGMALRIAGIFMLLAAVVATFQLLHISSATAAANTYNARFNNFAAISIRPDSDPIWLIGRAIIVLLLAAFSGVLIFWCDLIRLGSAVAATWAAAVSGLLCLGTVLFDVIGPGANLIAALIFVAPAPYHHIMPLRTRILFLACLIAWLLLCFGTAALAGLVWMDHSRNQLKSVPAKSLLLWQVFQESFSISVAGSVLAAAIIMQIRAMAVENILGLKTVVPLAWVVGPEIGFLSSDFRPTFVYWVLGFSLLIASNMTLFAFGGGQAVAPPTRPALIKAFLVVYLVILVLAALPFVPSLL